MKKDVLLTASEENRHQNVVFKCIFGCFGAAAGRIGLMETALVFYFDNPIKTAQV